MNITDRHNRMSFQSTVEANIRLLPLRFCPVLRMRARRLLANQRARHSDELSCNWRRGSGERASEHRRPRRSIVRCSSIEQLTVTRRAGASTSVLLDSNNVSQYTCQDIFSQSARSGPRLVLVSRTAFDWPGASTRTRNPSDHLSVPASQCLTDPKRRSICTTYILRQQHHQPPS